MLVYLTHGLTTFFFLFLDKAATLYSLIVHIHSYQSTLGSLSHSHGSLFQNHILVYKNRVYVFNSVLIGSTGNSHWFLSQKRPNYKPSKLASLRSLKFLLPSITFNTEAWCRWPSWALNGYTQASLFITDHC